MLSQDYPLITLFCDNFGNYVIQKMLRLYEGYNILLSVNNCIKKNLEKLYSNETSMKALLKIPNSNKNSLPDRATIDKISEKEASKYYQNQNWARRDIPQQMPQNFQRNFNNNQRNFNNNERNFNQMVFNDTKQKNMAMNNKNHNEYYMKQIENNIGRKDQYFRGNPAINNAPNNMNQNINNQHMGFQTQKNNN